MKKFPTGLDYRTKLAPSVPQTTLGPPLLYLITRFGDVMPDESHIKFGLTLFFFVTSGIKSTLNAGR